MRYLLLSLVSVVATSQPYIIETVAGGVRFDLPSQATPASDIQFIQPEGIAGGPQGDTYISDTYYDRILRVNAAGTASVFAGSVTGFAGDGGPAGSARFSFPGCLTIGPGGDLFVCDMRNGRIRRIAATSGTVTTYAERLGNPRAIAFDSAGVLHFADSFTQIIGKVDSAGVVTVIAGRANMAGFSGDGGPATAATLNSPMGLAIDTAGNIFVSDTNNHRIRRITPQGVISTISGTGVAGLGGNNVQALGALQNGPLSLAINRQGDLFIGDGRNGLVRRIRNGILTTVAGGGNSQTMPGRASLTDFIRPASLSLDQNQQLLVIDSVQRRVYRIDTANDTINAVAGSVVLHGGGDGGPATSASMITPFGMAIAADGSILVADTQDHRVRKIDQSGVIAHFAGNGRPENSGDGGPAVTAGMGQPRGMAVDRDGNVYIVGTRGAVVRKVSPAGVISTFAGGPLAGFLGDGLAATSARLQAPTSVAVDRDGNVYIADSGNHRIRRVNGSGIISTFAGSNQSGFAGDGGPAGEARLFNPNGVAVDGEGNVYISDTQNNRIRRVNSEGVISTVAQLNLPGLLAIDARVNLLIAQDRQIRALRADGSLVVVAGNGLDGFAGDGGPATQARITIAAGIAIGADETIYFADQGNERVRKLTPVQIAVANVVNLASQLGGPLAPNQLIRIPGSRLGPAAPLTATPAEGGVLPKSLGGVEVLMDGNPIPLFLVHESVVVAIVPAAVSGNVQLQVSCDGRTTNPMTLQSAPASPGVFVVNAATGKGPADALNAEGARVSAQAPAPIGSEVTIRVTGAGAVDPPIADGVLAGDDSSKPQLPIEVMVGGKPAEVLTAYVPAGQLAGTVVVRFRVPEGETGELPLVVSVQGVNSQADVTLAVGLPPSQ